VAFSQLRGWFGSASNNRRAEAVAYIHNRVTPAERQKFRAAIAADPDLWWLDLHFQTGAQVRNLLRAGGFDEESLDVIDLDDAWAELLKEAVRE
jgi:hypothetical protein